MRIVYFPIFSRFTFGCFYFSLKKIKYYYVKIPYFYLYSFKYMVI